MKKTRFIALLITAAMITTSAVSVPAYAQETSDSSTSEWENKLGDPTDTDILRSDEETGSVISEYLADLLEDAEENDKIIVDIDIIDSWQNETIRDEVRSRMIADGTWDEIIASIPTVEWTEADEEELRKYISEHHSDEPQLYENYYELYKRDALELRASAYDWDVNNLPNHELVKEVYKQENHKMAEALDLSADDIMEISPYFPMITANLTKSEIMRIAESDYVVGITNHVSPDTDIDVVDVEDEDTSGRPLLDTTTCYLSGDFDKDGTVDSSDALALLRGSVENNEFTQEETWLCDLDGDGIITSNDALLILRKSVGLA